MHAFLIVGKDKKKVEEKAQELATEKESKLIKQTLKTINDVRELNKLTRLTLTEPTSFIINDIDEAGEEALNAFLKNLEEPQENLFYILTTSNIHKVMSTIISRCQIITISEDKKVEINSDIEKFLNFSIGEKLNFVDKIKDRGEATTFIENFIELVHQKINSKSEDLDKLSQNAEIALITLKYLSANGNVNLQLANFVVSLV